MQIELKNFTSPDIFDLKRYIPDNKESFSFLLELAIGMKGKDGSDLFSIEVCTPKWMLENHQSYDIIFGRHKLIVFEYDIVNIIDAIRRYLNTITYNSWEDVTNQISKIALWEFEEYRP